MHTITIEPTNKPVKIRPVECRPEKTCQVLMVVSRPILNDIFAIRGINFHCIACEDALQKARAMKPNAILVHFQPGVHTERTFFDMREVAKMMNIPCLLYSDAFDKDARNRAIRYDFDDYYYGRLSDSLLRKLWLIRKSMATKRKNKPHEPQTHSTSHEYLFRRAFDIVVAASILLTLSPLLLLVALIIKLDSEGPVFYVSKRAGYNYKIFDFYKFRSMKQNADLQLSELAKNNQYGQSAFVKIKDDPRVTPFGRFLRKTSIDELPQLINVVKGDMSLVGNRPLPLYEAEQLTRDQIAGRFLAPAGVTGLWQVTKRGKDNMSEAERISLDIEYAQKNSFIYDLRLLVSTVPALLQKEAV